jgi:hypothetical protein
MNGKKARQLRAQARQLASQALIRNQAEWRMDSWRYPNGSYRRIYQDSKRRML